MSIRYVHLLLLAVLSISGCGTKAVSQSDVVPPAEYSLGEGDLISIQVFDEPDLTMDARIGANGIINYSYLGDLRVVGKTPEEVENQIVGLLSDGYLVNPSVNVTIDAYRPFFINGEVRNPGSYSFQPGLNLDKAIALAGGMTDRASRRKIFIVRANSDNNSPVQASTSTMVQPGDIISVREGFF